MKTSTVAVLASALAATADAGSGARALKSNKSGKAGKGKSKSGKAATMMTAAMIADAQRAWGDGIVAINAAYEAGGDYVGVATDHIDTLYGYDFGDVFFKPTLAASHQFRPTFEDALSYFVGPAAPGHIAEDTGFAIKGWTAVRFENEPEGRVLVNGRGGSAMGNYFFTADGAETKVEYSFGYFLDSSGNVRINLHHSSLPYDPPAGPAPATLTMEMLEAAQQAWGDGIVRIAAAHEAGEDYETVAREHIDSLYGYDDESPVLFKPTLAAERQFRPTFDDALSYFVATGHISEDTGFAIKGWTAVRFENDGGVLLHGDVGFAMGNYFFTGADGTETKVEYSFGYLLYDGVVRINLHHSSMPYDPNA